MKKLRNAKDGAATGSTIISTVRILRKIISHSRLVVVVPVSPKGTVNLLRNEEIDHVEVITSPKGSNFGSIEQYYQILTKLLINKSWILFKEV